MAPFTSGPNSIHINTPATTTNPNTLNNAIFNTFFIVILISNEYLTLQKYKELRNLPKKHSFLGIAHFLFSPYLCTVLFKVFFSHIIIMNATIVVYGSSTGTCEAIAEKIAQKLGCEVINVQDLTTDVVSNNKNLILGTSTWGAGELQDDWYDGLKVLQEADLSDKTIALFGCGDCESYSDTFVGGIGELYNGIKESGATFIGSVETYGYTFDDSEAVVDGKFIGLPLDDVNEDDKTDLRIDAWIAAITPAL
jgi:flavodoxin I